MLVGVILNNSMPAAKGGGGGGVCWEDVGIEVLTLAKREWGRGVGLAPALCTASAWPAASLGKLAM